VPAIVTIYRQAACAEKEKKLQQREIDLLILILKFWKNHALKSIKTSLIWRRWSTIAARTTTTMMEAMR